MIVFAAGSCIRLFFSLQDSFSSSSKFQAALSSHTSPGQFIDQSSSASTVRSNEQNMTTFARYS
jgi:hypothetical protein